MLGLLCPAELSRLHCPLAHPTYHAGIRRIDVNALNPTPVLLRLDVNPLSRLSALRRHAALYDPRRVTRYDDLLDGLRAAYDEAADRRDRAAKSPWKLEERSAFLERLHSERCRRLLEIGAGTGQDRAFFREQGVDVVATDLSPQMVARCRAKGLDARVMDFRRLDFPEGSFDAVYALNCLLHVPNADFPAVLTGIRTLIRPGGLFFLGVYGGDGEEGPAEVDSHHPPRFFSRRTDEQLRRFASGAFEMVDFHVREVGDERFQSLTLRRAVPSGAPRPD